jgi:hypothetical protein
MSRRLVEPQPPAPANRQPNKARDRATAHAGAVHLPRYNGHVEYGNGEGLYGRAGRHAGFGNDGASCRRHAPKRQALGPLRLREQFDKAHKKAMKIHAGLFRRLTQ